MNRNRTTIPAALFALLLLAVAGGITAPLAAFQLTPMKIELEPRGNGSSTSLTVANTNPDPIAVQIRTLSRTVLPDGSERTDATDGLFRVYPSQMIVQPGQTQVVRLQYTGPADVAVQEAYRLEARQLPINVRNRDAEGGTGVKIVLRYLATLYVGPSDAAPQLNVRVRDFDADAGTGELVIENRGTGYADLIGRAVAASAPGRSAVLSLVEFGGDYAASLPAGFVRVIPLNGELDFEPREFEVIAD
ncbi:MAG: fimbria/pilus periplasmic chaperone [Spirochaeta sp.]|jgi:fimbrial chaperone protein|nr:fimbria/pilus periplasmic chaperone [Spirochaeta sp.]